jgi:hypothetical protein
MIWSGSVDVEKARNWINTDLWVCSSWGRLAQLLLARIEQEPRSITAFVGKWVDVDALASYEIGAPPWARSKDPFQEELAAFVQSYLASSDRAFLLCQAGSSKKTLEIWDWSVPPRHFCDGENEVYYVLKSEDRDLGRIDDTLGDGLGGHFGAGICAKSSPDWLGKELDASILEEAAASAEHLIVPAFDGDGYLVWGF